MSGAVSSSDRAFLRYFSLMIGILALVAVALIVLAAYIYGTALEFEDPLRGGAIDRLQPVAAVYSGDTGRAKMQAAQAAALAAAAAQVAYGGSTDGEVIYGKLCHSCHTAGVAGSPVLGNQADWGPRIAQGIDILIQHAIEGYDGPLTGIMPAKGGNPALTDEQVAATVKWMVAQVK